MVHSISLCVGVVVDYADKKVLKRAEQSRVPLSLREKTFSDLKERTQRIINSVHSMHAKLIKKVSKN